MTTIIKPYGKKPTSPKIDTGDGLTKQNHKNECDINMIMLRYQKTGIIQHRVDYEDQYDDATGVDFQEAMNLVKSAEKMFSDLPSSVRKQFQNDPSEFMKFVNDPENQDEMISMGLATDSRPEPDKPVQVQVVNSEIPPIKP